MLMHSPTVSQSLSLSIALDLTPVKAPEPFSCQDGSRAEHTREITFKKGDHLLQRGSTYSEVNYPGGPATQGAIYFVTATLLQTRAAIATIKKVLTTVFDITRK